VAREGFANVNGTRLHYEISGSGAPVVLIHGLCLDLRMWDEQVPALTERCRVIRYDVRGFGKSDQPGHAAFRHADDLRALLDELGIGAVHVVGLSMGGRIALHHALLYPQQTLSLTMVDSALDGYEWSDEWTASLDAIEERARAEGTAAGNAMWLEHELFTPARSKAQCSAKLAEIVTECSGQNWVDESPAQGIDPPGGRRLAEVSVPTLVVVGEHDLPDFKRIADKLAAEISQAKRVAIADCGDMSNMEQPRAFNALLLEFLQAQNRIG